MLTIWLKHYSVKFKLGALRFKFVHELSRWSLPFSIKFPNPYWEDWAIGFLTFGLSVAHKDSMWTRVMWEVEDEQNDND